MAIASREDALRVLDRIVTFARFADPAANASPNEQAQAARNILPAAAELRAWIGAGGAGPTSKGPSAPHPPRPSPVDSLAREAFLLWWKAYPDKATLPADYEATFRRLAARLTLADFQDAIAATVRSRPRTPILYFFSICWRKYRGDT